MIQSVYGSFGSGVVAPGTGVVLQNRAAGFVEDETHPNRLAPGRRPFHTIIPGMLVEGGSLLGPFGVMGGPMQPQGHMQVVLRLIDHGDDPQAALDAPRWRVGTGREVSLEPGVWHAEPELGRLGHEVTRGAVVHDFGVGQAILRLGDALIGGPTVAAKATPRAFSRNERPSSVGYIRVYTLRRMDPSNEGDENRRHDEGNHRYERTSDRSPA